MAPPSDASRLENTWLNVREIQAPKEKSLIPLSVGAAVLCLQWGLPGSHHFICYTVQSPPPKKNWVPGFPTFRFIWILSQCLVNRSTTVAFSFCLKHEPWVCDLCLWSTLLQLFDIVVQVTGRTSSCNNNSNTNICKARNIFIKKLNSHWFFFGIHSVTQPNME